MQYEISDEDIIKVSAIVDNPAIRDRASYIQERNEFVESYPSEYAETIFDLIRHGIFRGIIYIDIIPEEVIDSLAVALSSGNFEFQWPDEIVQCPFTRDALIRCYRCGEFSWESEMREANKEELTCPHCTAISKPLGRRHVRVEQFRIITKEE